MECFLIERDKLQNFAESFFLFQTTNIQKKTNIERNEGTYLFAGWVRSYQLESVNGWQQSHYSHYRNGTSVNWCKWRDFNSALGNVHWQQLFLSFLPYGALAEVALCGWRDVKDPRTNWIIQEMRSLEIFVVSSKHSSAMTHWSNDEFGNNGYTYCPLCCRENATLTSASSAQNSGSVSGDPAT